MVEAGFLVATDEMHPLLIDIIYDDDWKRNVSVIRLPEDETVAASIFLGGHIGPQ